MTCNAKFPVLGAPVRVSVGVVNATARVGRAVAVGSVRVAVSIRPARRVIKAVGRIHPVRRVFFPRRW